MAPAHIPVFLSHKPGTENGLFRVVVLRLAWVPSDPESQQSQNPRSFNFSDTYAGKLVRFAHENLVPKTKQYRDSRLATLISNL